MSFRVTMESWRRECFYQHRFVQLVFVFLLTVMQLVAEEPNVFESANAEIIAKVAKSVRLQRETVFDLAVCKDLIAGLGCNLVIPNTHPPALVRRQAGLALLRWRARFPDEVRIQIRAYRDYRDSQQLYNAADVLNCLDGESGLLITHGEPVTHEEMRALAAVGRKYFPDLKYVFDLGDTHGPARPPTPDGRSDTREIREE